MPRGQAWSSYSLQVPVAVYKFATVTVLQQVAVHIDTGVCVRRQSEFQLAVACVQRSGRGEPILAPPISLSSRKVVDPESRHCSKPLTASTDPQAIPFKTLAVVRPEDRESTMNSGISQL